MALKKKGFKLSRRSNIPSDLNSFDTQQKNISSPKD